MLDLALINLHTIPVDEQQLLAAVRCVCTSAQIDRGEISVTIVGEAQMHALNRQHLNHDYPTDVLSFVLEESAGYLEGEIIASSHYAASEAARYGWSPAEELLLYVVHGALHLVGHDDTTPAAAATMRAAERAILATFGLVPPGRE